MRWCPAMAMIIATTSVGFIRSSPAIGLRADGSTDFGGLMKQATRGDFADAATVEFLHKVTRSPPHCCKKLEIHSTLRFGNPRGSKCSAIIQSRVWPKPRVIAESDLSLRQAGLFFGFRGWWLGGKSESRDFHDSCNPKPLQQKKKYNYLNNCFYFVSY
jgi:hypothetical protein